MRSSIIFLFVLVASTPTFSQWVPSGGPNGGSMGKIVSIGSDLFVSAGSGGVYKSSNNGESWVRSSQGLPSSINDLVVQNEILYVSVFRSGIYKSEDKGATWVPINSGIENEIFYNIAVNGSDIYAANGYDGVYYSSDNGETWEEKNSGISDDLIKDFGFFNSEVYAGGKSLYKSDDNGDSWTVVQIPGLSTNGVSAITVTDNAFFVGGVDGQVFVSSDNLNSWNDVSINFGGTIKTLGSSADSVFLTTANGAVYYTKNNGSSWTQIQNSNTDSFVSDIIFLDGKMIMSTNEGLYKSLDGGISWSTNNAGINALTIESLNFNDQYIFAGTFNQGIFRSSDRGDNWEDVSAGLNNLNAKAVKDIVVIGESVYLGTGGGVYESSNNGDGWILNFDPGINKSIQTLSYDQGRFVAAVGGNGVYTSIDTTKTWQLTSTDALDIETVFESSYLKGDTIIVGTYSGEMFLSQDFGETWKDISIPDDYIISNNFQWDGEVFYALTSNGLYYTSDLGESWSLLNNDSSLSFYDAIISGDEIFAASQDGVYITRQDRNQWYKISEVFESFGVVELTLIDDKVFAGTFAASVWSRPVTELVVPEILGAEIEPSANVLVYPNPVESSLNIKYKERVKGLNVKLFNSFGREIKISFVEHNSINEIINMNGYPSGIYFLQIKTNTKTITKKVIKE